MLTIGWIFTENGDMAQLRVSDIDLISTKIDGTQGNDSSSRPSISADGTKIAFRSFASNLVSGDTNRSGDLFVKDTATGELIRANTTSNGIQANASPWEFSSISGDGGKVGFLTRASNLVSGDTNKVDDVFVKDLASGKIVRASTDAKGVQANDDSFSVSLTADGGKVVFTSSATNLVPRDTNGAPDVFLKDLKTGAITLVSASPDGVSANAGSFAPTDQAVSADGTKVLFSSTASNLVPGDTNGQSDVFVKDTRTGAVTLVSVAADGTRANGDARADGISDDGMKVMFGSDATNLVADDTNGVVDIFVKDLLTGVVVRANTSADGAESRFGPVTIPAISGDGTMVSFRDHDNHLVPNDTDPQFSLYGTSGFYVKHLPTGAITQVTEGAGSRICRPTAPKSHSTLMKAILCPVTTMQMRMSSRRSLA